MENGKTVTSQVQEYLGLSEKSQGVGNHEHRRENGKSCVDDSRRC